MIKQEFVKVYLNNSNSKYYTDKGYNIVDNYFIIKPIDLAPYSKTKILCCCDICEKEKYVVFSNYRKITEIFTKKYYCKKCGYIKSANKLKSKTHEEKLLIKNKKEKNNLEKYGEKYPIQNTTIKERCKKIILEKYGVENVSELDIIKEKKKATFNDRYGKDAYFLLPQVKEKANISYKSYIIKENEKISKKYSNKIGNDFRILNYEFGVFNILDLRDNTEFKISNKILSDRLKWNNTEISTLKNQIGSKNTSGLEYQLKEWIKSLNISYIENTKKIITPKEIDIYIPSHNIAIEFNGLYWHSDKFLHKNYHLEKTSLCKKKNIELLHIYEDDWTFKQDIIKSILSNRFGTLKNKIYAKFCIIKIVDDLNTIYDFLEKNHIEGYSQGDINLGLYHDEELVYLMSFNTKYKKEIEIIRFCNKINSNVVGGASKLFKYFKSNYTFDKIFAYSDHSLFNGNIFKILKFEKIILLEPKCYHIINNKRVYKPIIEKEVYRLIWDCGHYIWLYTKKD